MNHWSKHNKNPNDPSLREERGKSITRIIATTPVDRISLIRNLAKGKKVLDVGCVSHFSEAEQQDEWLHRHIVDSADECVGIDILDAEVAALAEQGYRVITHDLTAVPMAEEFDVVVCGELIEHLGNVSSFLSNSHKSLVTGGIMVITTPFPWFLGNVIRSLIPGKILPGSLDHACWYDPSTVCELSERHGYRLTHIQPIEPSASEKGSGILEFIYGWIRKGRIPGISRWTGSRSLLYVLEKCATS